MTVKLPPTSTLPVVVIESVKVSLKRNEVVPKSISLSVTEVKHRLVFLLFYSSEDTSTNPHLLFVLSTTILFEN